MNKQVLILETNEKNYILLSKILNAGSFSCKSILNIKEYESIKEDIHSFELVIFNTYVSYIEHKDVVLACDNGHNLQIPTICIDNSSEHNSKMLQKCFDEGTSDYIKKPFDSKEILRRVSLRHQDFIKMKAYKLKVDKFAKLATVDQLSKLTSKMQMQAILKHQINYFNRYKNDTTIIYLSLLNINKTVNLFGLTEGEKLIQSFAKELQDNIRETDVLARWEGSEFTLMLPNTNIEASKEVVRKLNTYFSKIQILKETRIDIAFGITPFIMDDTIKEMVGRGKLALAQAKQEDYNKVFVL